MWQRGLRLVYRFIGQYRRGLLGLTAVLLILRGLDGLFPVPVPAPDDGVTVVARDGSPLRAYPSSNGFWRHQITPAEVSPIYQQALLHYEDRWFYWHPGVNPVALLRAAWQWAWHGRIVSGGSTLTMQVARRFDPPARTVLGKAKQTVRALQLEWHYSKDEILTFYLNYAPMGGVVEGTEMASRLYLGKSAKKLSAAEAALLVALPQAPSRRRPDRAAEAARLARDKIIKRMLTQGVWDTQTVEDALLEPIVASTLKSRWVAPLVAQRLFARTKKHQNHTTERAIISTTLDIELQRVVERLLADRVQNLPPKVSLAALVMDNDSHEVLAYAGSADFLDNSRAAHVDMVRGLRSPGSTLKPFLYAAALDAGLIHSESLLVDAPHSFHGYEPGNFQASFSGPVSVSEALQHSLNVPAVDLLERLGSERFAVQLRSAGLRLRMAHNAPPNLSVILGGASTKLEELVGAYHALARGGMAAKPRLQRSDPKLESRAMSEGAAWIVREILSGGERPDRPFDETPGVRPLAWKTGTSFGFRDAWAIGVTPQYTLGVWVGRPDGTPNPGFFGANVAAPLLKDIVAALPSTNTAQSAVSWQRPSTVQAVNICWPLGLAAAETAANDCHQKRSAWTLQGVTPPTLSDRIRPGPLNENIWVDSLTGKRITPACQTAAMQPMSYTVTRWPSALLPWLDGALLARLTLPAWHPTCLVKESTNNSSSALKIVGLENSQQIRPVPGAMFATLNVQALGTSEPVWWLLDGKQVNPIKKPGATTSHALAFQVNQIGQHTLTAYTADGASDWVTFTYRSTP